MVLNNNSIRHEKNFNIHHSTAICLRFANIKEDITQRPFMIAVGCRHLLGSNSLIALLRREGYTVEPVKNK